MFFNIGGGEILVIALVALIAVGPEQLPSVLRKLGRFVAQARTVTSNLRDEFMSGLDEVNDFANPEKWTGSGTDDDPVVPRGFAERQATEDAAAKPAVNEIAAANAMRAAEPETVDPEPAASTADAAAVDDADGGVAEDGTADPAPSGESAARNGDRPGPADGELGADRP